MSRYVTALLVVALWGGCSLLEPDPPEITSHVFFTAGDLGNEVVESSIAGTEDGFGCAARVNGGEWVFGTLGDDACTVPIPSDSFGVGSNTVEVAKAGNTKIGPVQEHVLYKGSVEANDTGIDCSLSVQVGVDTCDDVVVDINLESEYNGQLNLRMLPDSSGAIAVKGLDMWGFHVNHQGYEQYHQNMEHVTGAYTDQVTLRESVSGTSITGRYLYRDSTGTVVPIQSDQSAWLHAIYQGPAGDGVGRYAAESVSVGSGSGYSSSTGAFEIDNLAGGVYELVYFWTEQNVESTIGNIAVTPGQEKAVGDIVIDP